MLCDVSFNVTVFLNVAAKKKKKKEKPRYFLSAMHLLVLYTSINVIATAPQSARPCFHYSLPSCLGLLFFFVGNVKSIIHGHGLPGETHQHVWVAAAPHGLWEIRYSGGQR